MIFISDFPDVSVGPDNPYRVELDHTAELVCRVDSKPPTESVRWEYSGRFIDTNFRHVIPQVNKSSQEKCQILTSNCYLNLNDLVNISI